MPQTLNVNAVLPLADGNIEVPAGSQIEMGSGEEITTSVTVMLDGQMYLLEPGDRIEIVGRQTHALDAALSPDENAIFTDDDKFGQEGYDAADDEDDYDTDGDEDDDVRMPDVGQ